MSIAQKTLVWDVPTRLFHWIMAFCFAGAWISHEMGAEGFWIHKILGYTLLALVIWRLGWGLLGTRYARFSSFIRGPGAVLRYLGDQGSTQTDTDPGHNPAGGWAILAMLALLAVQAVSGLGNGGELLMEGPWFHALSGSYQDLAHEIHEISFNLLLALVAMHLGAVLFHRLRHGKNLVAAMLTGRQETRPGIQGINSHGYWQALVLLACAATVVWALVSAAPPPSMGGMDSF